MAYTSTSDSIIIKATLTDKGRQLLSRGKFKIAKFALGDDELDYKLLDDALLKGTTIIRIDDEDTVYKQAIRNSKIFEAYSNRHKNIQYGLDSYDEGVLYLERSEIEEMAPNLHAKILYKPSLKVNKKLTI